MRGKFAGRFVGAGSLFAAGATALWAGNFIIARGVSDQIPSISLNFYRWLTAAIVFAPFAMKGWLRDWPVIRRHPWYFTLTSLLGVTIFNTLVYMAGHTTSAMNLSLISITFPVFVLILERIWFKQAISAQRGAGIVIVLLGVICLITRGHLSVLLHISFAIGDLWMLLAAVIFSLYSLLLRQKPKGISINSLQFSCFMLGLLFLLPAFAWQQLSQGPCVLTATTGPAVLYVGIFASLVAFICWNRAVDTMGPSKAAMVYYTSPVFSGILAWVFLKEPMGVIHLVSLSMILSGIGLTNRG